MGLSAFERLFEARENELAQAATAKQVLDPLFPARETSSGYIPYDPMGEHDFNPATGDGKIK